MKFCMNCMSQYGDEYSICPICSFKEGTLPTDLRCMEPGQVLAERYIIGMPLTIDSWIIRYIGWDALTERKVVINEYFPTRYAVREVGNVPLTVVKQKSFYKYMAVLLKKTQLLSETHMPDNISSVYECFEKNNTAYIITEFFDGRPLADYISEKKPMEMKSIERLMLPMLKSIDKLHENGFISGGYSPDNFIVTDDNVLILNNYIGNILYNITDSGTELKGSSADKYFPYERLTASETIELSPENDVYSAAMIIYEMLGAELPDTNKRKELYDQKHKDMLKKPSAYGSKIDSSKQNALMNAAAVNISDRTANMETFIKELTSGKDVTLLSKKQSKFPLWAKITIPIAVVLVVAAAIIIPILLNQKSPTVDTLGEGQTIVPSIVNYSLSEATAELQKRNLMIEIEGKETNDDKDADTVLSQNVNKGSIVSENTIVGVKVSAKSGEFTMPNFLGIDLKNCTDVLENIGMNYSVEQEFNKNISAGCVVSQSIAPYSKVTAGQRVSIIVSKGPEAEVSQPEEKTPVDKLLGQTYQEIAENPSSSSAPVEVVQRVYDNTVPEGTVVQQYPGPGEKAYSNEPVKIVVTTSNENVLIPDITYLDQERCTKVLKYFGLNAEFDNDQSDTVAEGLAISQTPEGGKPGKIGDTVKVVLSRGKEAVKVPDAVGKMRDESVKLMKTSGLAVSYTFENDSTKPRDEVLAQSIAGGTEVKKGTPIILTLNAANDVVKIPDIIGKTVSEADEMIVKAGFNLIIYVDDDHPYSDGIVAAQGPKAGLFAPKGGDVVVLLDPSPDQQSGDTGLKISAEDVKIRVGEEYKIAIDISQIKTVSAVTYDIADTEILQMTNINKEPLEMTFQGMSPGKTEVTISCGDIKQICTFEVTENGDQKPNSPPEIKSSVPEFSAEPETSVVSEPSEEKSITISPENVSIDVGMVFVMTINTTGIEDLTAVEYDISDESVIGVDHIDKATLSMTFKGLAKGNASIIISCGPIKKICRVEVT